MFKYRNNVTGQILEIPCRLSGGGWEPVIVATDSQKPEKTDIETPKKSRKKKSE